MTSKEKKRERQKEVIEKVRKGNKEAISELIRMFHPLILKTSSMLSRRYGGLVPFEDFVRDGTYLLIYLTMMEYDPNGKAKFPRFIETHLHAKLVQMYRPVAAWRKRIVYLGERNNLLESKIDTHTIVEQAERDKIMLKIEEFININFNEREIAVVNEFICGTVPRAQLAERFGISKMRMKAIHIRCMGKLKVFLKKMGVKGIEDI